MQRKLLTNGNAFKRTDNHMNVIAAALKNVYDRRHEITRGVKITWEAELMRHFTVQLEPLG